MPIFDYDLEVSFVVLWPSFFWKQLKIQEVETFSPVLACKNGSRFAPEKRSVVCLSTKGHLSQIVCSPTSYGISGTTLPW